MVQPPEEWTVLSMLNWGTRYFQEKQVHNPRFSIEWLLADVLKVKRLDLYLMFDRPLSAEQLQALRPLVKRRAKHEPLQYITGSTNFMGATIQVQPGVLIPRPETEQMVELVLSHFEHIETPLNILDIGTGSGCIPVALKQARPHWNLWGMDISPTALEIARSNASINNVDVTFFEGDLFSPDVWLDNRTFDCIISNPPYILPEEKESLPTEVAEFEPELALFCSSTQTMYNAIQQLAEKALIKNGILALELNERFAAEVHSLFSSSNWEAELVQDYDHKQRFLLAKKK